MTDYQSAKINELTSQGWCTPKLVHGEVYRLESAAGMRAYVYPSWIQFIA